MVLITDDGAAPDASPEEPVDSLKQFLHRPAFLGIQSLAECLFYERSTSYCGVSESLYEAVSKAQGSKDGVHLYTLNGVDRVRKQRRLLRITSARTYRDYHEVIVTAPPWSLEVDAAFDNFQPKDLPWDVRDAMTSSHFITSCKVFYPLKERYWEDPKSKIPQVIVTDTFLQGVYGMAVESSSNAYPGVILISYTWEDDATKLVADDDDKLAKGCLAYLDSVLMRCKNVKQKISPYVNMQAPPKVFHWEREPSYRGCARLYRQGSWELDYALLTYNQNHSATSHLYLAGEAYSVEGGWVEPALRSALDAVIHVVKNTGGQFHNKGFDFERDYPKILLRAS